MKTGRAQASARIGKIATIAGISNWPITQFWQLQIFQGCKSLQESRHDDVLRDMTITKKLRLVFYLFATIELVLVSVVWGRLPLH